MKALRFALYKIGGWVRRSWVFQALFAFVLISAALCAMAAELIKERFATLKKEYAEFMAEGDG